MSEPLPEYGVCPWPMDPVCVDSEDWEALITDAPLYARAVALASMALQQLTGRRVGGCPITVRPCKPSACASFPDFYGAGSGPGWTPANLGGVWSNCGGCAGCTGTACEVELPAPVGRVDEVTVDGVVIPPADYRVENAKYLVWQGAGPCPWPNVQDMSLQPGEPGTFTVTYLNAYPVDRIGAQSAAILALEFAKACDPANQDCALPPGTVAVVRQGVSYEIQPGLFPGGYTGIRSVDAYVADWNPNNLRQGATVWSPGMPEPRITTSGG